MPFSMEWMYSKRIIYAHAWGELTYEDAQAGSKEYFKLVEEGIPFIHSILDLREVEKYPSLAKIRDSMTGKMTSKEGWMIFVGGNSALRFVVTVVMQLFNYRFRMVKTPEEAIQFLIQHDETLYNAVIEIPARPER